MATSRNPRSGGFGQVAVMALHPQPENVREAREVVARAAGAAGATRARVGDLVVAVSEACTNAIEAHVAAHDEGLVDLQVVREANELVVTVEDRGRGFDPGARAPRPRLGHPDHLSNERGWGIDLMRALVDHLTFERTSLGTRVRLVIDVPPM